MKQCLPKTFDKGVGDIPITLTMGRDTAKGESSSQSIRSGQVDKGWLPDTICST